MEERLAQGEMMNLRVKLGSEVTTDPTYSELRSPAASFISGFLSDTNGHPRSAFPAQPMSYPFAVHVLYSDIF